MRGKRNTRRGVQIGIGIDVAELIIAPLGVNLESTVSTVDTVIHYAYQVERIGRQSRKYFSTVRLDSLFKTLLGSVAHVQISAAR